MTHKTDRKIFKQIFVVCVCVAFLHGNCNAFVLVFVEGNVGSGEIAQRRGVGMHIAWNLCVSVWLCCIASLHISTYTGTFPALFSKATTAFVEYSCANPKIPTEPEMMKKKKTRKMKRKTKN